MSSFKNHMWPASPMDRLSKEMGCLWDGNWSAWRERPLPWVGQARRAQGEARGQLAGEIPVRELAWPGVEVGAWAGVRAVAQLVLLKDMLLEAESQLRKREGHELQTRLSPLLGLPSCWPQLTPWQAAGLGHSRTLASGPGCGGPAACPPPNHGVMPSHATCSLL